LDQKGLLELQLSARSVVGSLVAANTSTPSQMEAAILPMAEEVNM